MYKITYLLFILSINPLYTPDAKIQLICKESIKNNFTLTFDSWTTHRKTVNPGAEFQFAKNKSSKISSLNSLIVVRQIAARVGPGNTANYIAIFGKIDVEQHFVEIVRVKNPKDPKDLEYNRKIYLNQYTDLEIFPIFYVGELFLNHLQFIPT